ncbi:MAG TPA: hydantoinase/oxoprolinase family protein, partial [Gemmatimonadaceae bacterium]|nr:hydantoinase/oxoprolinase family protein [Gemmatimonadaceae bacterium]
MTIGAWLDARRPAPPENLAARVRRALGPSLERPESDVVASCLGAVEKLLLSLRDDPEAGREVALDLLAADALVTYAFEAARMHRFKRGSGLPLRIPAVDLIEIGAGGGSIARVDRQGLLGVGPRSAGSDPGPACYGRGGRDPTVTDADLLLGYLDPGYFLGGEMRLDRDAARRAVEDRLARPLGRDAMTVAWGIHDIVNDNMASAARVHLAERGRDPRAYALVATGGAGPVHAHRI